MLRTFAKLLVILFLSLPTCFAWTFEPSPAGGGWLEVSKPGGYAFVEDHDDFDFDANLGNEFTYEMWMYLKRPPRFRETWVLLHKEGSYLLALEGWKVGLFGAISPLDERYDSLYFLLSYEGKWCLEKLGKLRSGTAPIEPMASSDLWLVNIRGINRMEYLPISSMGKQTSVLASVVL